MPSIFRKSNDVPKTRKRQRIYAVGDIHGRYDLFRQILREITRHWERAPRDFSKIDLILLGDTIDRGPDSRLTLELVHSLVTRYGVRLLRGNHEDLLLKSMEGNAIAQEIWLNNGGLAFLESFDLAPKRPDEDSFDFGERIAAAVPQHLKDLLRRAPLMYRSGDYLFVHAGIRPGVPLHKQEEHDVLFIRDDFTKSRRAHGAVIVHGHTIVDEVTFLPNRIAIDTGAYASDRLSAICLQDERREVITT